LVLAFVSVLLPACGGSTGAPTGSADPKDCAAYITGFCTHEATCQRQTEAACEGAVGGTSCLGSVDLQTCADSLYYSVDCQHDPSGCSFEQVVDVPHEQQVCAEFEAAACAYYARCGIYMDASTCHAALLNRSGIDCSRALGSSKTVATCETELRSASCAAPPASCANVITFTQSGA